MLALRSSIAGLILVVLVALGVSRAAAPPLPRLDHYGDPLPRHAVARLGTTRLRHPGGASDLAFSADGKTLASSGHGVRLWRVADGRPMKYAEELASVTRVGNGLLALRATDGGLSLHDVVTGKDVGRVSRGGDPGNPDSRGYHALSPDGKRGVIGTLERFFVVDLSTGKQVEFEAKVMNLSFAFSRDGKTLACGTYATEKNRLTGGLIRFRDIATKKILRDTPVGRGAPYALALSDDGKTLAVSHGDLNFFNYSDTKTTAVTLCDAFTGKELRLLSRQGVFVSSLAFSPDGKTLAIGRADDPGTIELYDVKTGKEHPRPPGTEVKAVAASFRASGEIVTVGKDTTVHVWSEAGEPLAVTDLRARRPLALAIDHGGTRVAWAEPNGSLFVRDLTTNKEQGPLGIRDRSAWRLAFSPDGKALAVRGDGFRIWDFARSKAMVISKADDRRWWSAFTGDGSRFIMTSPDKGFALHDTATGKRLFDFEKPLDWNGSLASSPDGRTLAASHADQTISLWDATTGKKRGFHIWHPSNYPNLRASNPIAISPDGTLLATGGVGPEKTVRLWDVATGKERARLAGHPAGVTFLTFSPDGKRLLSGSRDSTALVWNVAAALTGRGR